MLKAPMPVPRHQLDMFLDLLLSAHSDHILRIKGLVQIEGESKPLVIQAVGNRLSEPYFLKSWPSDDHTTQLVVFLDGMKPEFVQRLFAGFLNMPQIDTPDSNALTANPLSIAGFSSGKKH
jgi:G3E family GTPase